MSATPAADQTFLFADLAGFTALTEAHGDERAADLIGQYFREVRKVLPAYGVTEVKSIGDALMLRAPEASQAVRLAIHLAREIGGQHGFPAVRVGLHTGSAVERDDDWFGAAVNLASRIAGAAVAGEVLVTEETKDAAQQDLPQCVFGFVGKERFKNIKNEVAMYAAVSADAPEARQAALVIDPVCRMAVDPVQSEWQRGHRGTSYVFCSAVCRDAFDADPGHYHRGHRFSTSRPRRPRGGGPQRRRALPAWLVRRRRKR